MEWSVTRRVRTGRLERCTEAPLCCTIIIFPAAPTCAGDDDRDDTAFTKVCFCLSFMPQLVKRCNEGAHTMERTEQMYTLQKQLEFGKIKV